MMQLNTDNFRDVVLAVIRSLDRLQPNWYRVLQSNPLDRPPSVSFETLVRECGRALQASVDHPQPKDETGHVTGANAGASD